ncbi:DUF3298 and DUF4163 domain-containing protein [uncultured Winogradskyella sp.]|uniref:DUF3298 and DUF4163 domain-containing protein n=1 Tax=uncultured Winogradskyella sp. TaxID=395353 RepID=UPI0026160726|nr:DUF3298 and DUF4163 domain-containing protein [uncultured Winogradskyella sp.]
MKPIVLLLISVLVLNSCHSEFKPVVFETTEMDMSFDADISLTYDKALGNEELSKIINFKIEEAIIATLSDATKKTKLDAILKDFNTEYVNFKKDFPEASEPVWELFIETEKIYQSEAVITIAISTYEFKGGAHGNDKIILLNLNAKTGAILNKGDIIENLKAFTLLAESHFKTSLKLKENTTKPEDYFFGKPFQLPENIGFSDDGLILLYNTYEVATYNKGYTEFVIPFKALTNHLKIK